MRGLQDDSFVFHVDNSVDLLKVGLLYIVV